VKSGARFLLFAACCFAFFEYTACQLIAGYWSDWLLKLANYPTNARFCSLFCPFLAKLPQFWKQKRALVTKRQPQ
jgi:hypothetical protein